MQERARPPAHGPQTAAEPSSEVAAETDEHDSLGNAAVQARMRQGAADPEDPRSMAEKQTALDLAFEAAESVLSRADATAEGSAGALAGIEARHGLQWLELEPDDGPRHVLDAKVNPQRVGHVVVLSHDDIVDLRLMARQAANGTDAFGAQLRLQIFRQIYGGYLAHPVLAWMDATLAAYLVYAQHIGPAATFTPPPPPPLVPAGLQVAVADLQSLAIMAPYGVDVGSSSSVGPSSSGDSGKKGAKRPPPNLDLDGAKDSTPGLEELRGRRKTGLSWGDLQLGQIEQLLKAMDALATLYIPDEDGADMAFAQDGIDRIPLHRTDVIAIPNNRGQRFEEEVPYSDGENRYFVTLLPVVDSGTIPALLDAPFAVRRSAAGGGTGAKGRAYSGDQGFYANPAYWGSRKPDDSVPKPATRNQFGIGDITEFASEGAARHAGLVPQNAAPTEPWVFCVPADFGRKGASPDPRQAANPGALRRTLPDFDKAGEKMELMRATVFQTRTPAKSRKQDKRDPQSEAGGVPASAFMEGGPVPAYAAKQGQLASHEYCHLVGDGDSGDCSASNLVVGTSGVNTEQLAMEETLRPFRPRLRRLGYALRLTVTAIIDDTPVKSVFMDEERSWPQGQMAQFIRYEMSAMPIDNALKGTEIIPIHTQVMDGQRGVITEAEVDFLKQTVSGKLDRVLEDLGCLEELLSGERIDGLDEERYERVNPGYDMPMSPSNWNEDAPKRKGLAHAPRDAVLAPDRGDRGVGPTVGVGHTVGRYSQGDYLGGGTACAGTSVRAASRLLSHGFANLDVEDTVQRGVSDYLTARAAHPGAPPFLATYEMRTASTNQDLYLDLVTAMTIRRADFGQLRNALEGGLFGRAATITAGGYTFTAARLHDGTFCVFDSHANRIHGRAYKERFASIQELMLAVKRIITEHGVNLHSDIAVEVYEEPD